MYGDKYKPMNLAEFLLLAKTTTKVRLEYPNSGPSEYSVQELRNMKQSSQNVRYIWAGVHDKTGNPTFKYLPQSEDF